VNNIQLGTISRNNGLDSGIIIKKNEKEKYLLLSKSLLISFINKPSIEAKLAIEMIKVKVNIKELLNSISNNETKEIATKVLD